MKHLIVTLVLAAITVGYSDRAFSGEKECRDILKSNPVIMTNKQIYDIASTRGIFKGQYEKASSYNSHIKASINDATFDLRAIGGAPYIVIRQRLAYGVDVKYSPDTETILLSNRYGGIVSVMTTRSAVDESVNIAFLDGAGSDRIRRPVGTYVGSTSFGVSRTISSFDDTIYVIGIGISKSSIYYDWPKSGIRYSFKVDPDSARRLVNNIGVMLVGTYATPHHIEYTYVHNANISDPEDRKDIRFGAVMNVSCAAIVDLQSGAYIGAIM